MKQLTLLSYHDLRSLSLKELAEVYSPCYYNGALFKLYVYQRVFAKHCQTHKHYSKEFNVKFLEKLNRVESYKTNIWVVRLWYYGTEGSVLSKAFEGYPDGRMPKSVTDLVYRYTNEFSDGYTHCSSCNRKIERDDIAGRYFAGVYCKECWENKYKAIEARETYA